MSTDVSAFIAGMKTAKVFGQGTNINPWAIYELEIEGVDYGPGFNTKLNAECAYCTPRFKVISCAPTKTQDQLKAAGYPVTKWPNAAGSSCSAPWPQPFDWAKSATAAFFMALTESTQEELVAEVTLPTGEKMVTMAYLVDPKRQPLKGCRIMCETKDKPLKGKDGSNMADLRTRLNFFHTDATRAATQKILG